MTTGDGGTSAPGKPGGAYGSLLVDEGAGALLAAAAGDVAAASSHPRGYSARTQAATVLAYHVIGHAGVVRADLASELAALDGEPESVYVRPSESFRAWLDSVTGGAPAVSSLPTSEMATRVVPLGVWFRTDPDALVRSAVEAVRVENLHAPSIAAAVAVAGAVAGSSLAMAGRDLVLGAGETALRAAALMESEDYRFSRVADAVGVGETLTDLKTGVGMPFDAALEAVAARGIGPELAPALASIVAAADPGADPVLTIDAAAGAGGPDGGFLVGALVGARLGLRRWPWTVPNETWFAEIGRRLVAHVTELRDLPIPYAVEQRMQSHVRVDPRAEMG
jgi:hypothetical protein